MAAKQGDRELIKPVEGSDTCPLHPKEELKLFCDRCLTPMCVECLCEEHEGHPHGLARKRGKEMMRGFEALRTQLQQRRKTVATLVTKRKDKRSELDRDYQAALQTLKKRYQADVKKCDAELSEAESDFESLDDVEKKTAKINSSSKLSLIVEMRAEMTAVLGQQVPGNLGMTTEELRNACKKLLTDSTRASFSNCKIGDTAVPLAFYEDCRNFTQGKSDIPPAPPQWPPQQQPLKCHKNDDTDVAFIPPEAATELLRLTGGHPDLALGKVNGHKALMAADGQARYVGSLVAGKCWFLPSKSRLGDAVTAVMGRRPRRITDLGGKTQYDMDMLCGKWRELYKGHLKVHY